MADRDLRRCVLAAGAGCPGRGGVWMREWLTVTGVQREFFLFFRSCYDRRKKERKKESLRNYHRVGGEKNSACGTGKRLL